MGARRASAPTLTLRVPRAVAQGTARAFARMAGEAAADCLRCTRDPDTTRVATLYASDAVQCARLATEVYQTILGCSEADASVWTRKAVARAFADACRLH